MLKRVLLFSLFLANEANAEYFGRPVTPRQILYGEVKVPAGARRLQRALAR